MSKLELLIIEMKFFRFRTILQTVPGLDGDGFLCLS